jgi:hypothetical protein
MISSAIRRTTAVAVFVIAASLIAATEVAGDVLHVRRANPDRRDRRDLAPSGV